MSNLSCSLHFYLKQHFFPQKNRFWFSLAPPLAVCVCVSPSVNTYPWNQAQKLLDMPLGNKKKNVTTLTHTAMLLWARWPMTFPNLRISYSRTRVLNLEYTSWYTWLNLPVNPTDILFFFIFVNKLYLKNPCFHNEYTHREKCMNSYKVNTWKVERDGERRAGKKTAEFISFYKI